MNKILITLLIFGTSVFAVAQAAPPSQFMEAYELLSDYDYKVRVEPGVYEIENSSNGSNSTLIHLEDLFSLKLNLISPNGDPKVTDLSGLHVRSDPNNPAIYKVFRRPPTRGNFFIVGELTNVIEKNHNLGSHWVNCYYDTYDCEPYSPDYSKCRIVTKKGSQLIERTSFERSALVTLNFYDVVKCNDFQQDYKCLGNRLIGKSVFNFQTASVLPTGSTYCQ